jgi:tripartite ATP-independent transporter DctM subunit
LAVALLGAPLFVVLAGVALLSFHGSGTDLVVLAEEHFKLTANPHLITIPFFTFAGYLMAESRAADRLVEVSRALFGWLPGGLAVVVVLSCAFFTTFTGASGVTIVALGGLLYPMLLEDGYPEEFSLGLITSSGAIGLLFPPSLPIILYGIVAGVSIDKLFVAGILPGTLMVGMFALYSMFEIAPGTQEATFGWRDDVHQTPFEWDRAAETFWRAKWELMVPVLVLVGIYGGFATVSEASALAAIYVLVAEVFIHGDLDLRGPADEEGTLAYAIRESMIMVGAILVILGIAMGLTNYLVQEQVPMTLLGLVEQYVQSRTTFLLLLTGFLLVVGTMMDIFSAIAVVVPLITPIAAEYGVDPVHLGIIFLANLELGYITPPFGLNLFISSLAFDEPVVKLYRVALPYLGLLLGTLLIITFWEDLSLWLVGFVYGG